jgi:hypothetical protein
MRSFFGLNISSISTLAYPGDYATAATEHVVLALYRHGIVLDIIIEIMMYFFGPNFID